MKKGVIRLVGTLMIGITCMNSISVFAQPLTHESKLLNLTIDNSLRESSLRASSGVITGDNVHFRKTPGLSGEIITYLNKGDNVMYTTSSNNIVEADNYTWREVVYNKQTGWVATIYLKDTDQ